MVGGTRKPSLWRNPAQRQRAGPQSPTPSGLSSGWDFSLWVAGVWHRMGHHAETVGDCGSLLLQSSPCLGTGSAGPLSAWVCIGQPFPPTGPRGQSLLRAEGRSRPDLARVWSASSGDPPQLREAWRQEHLLQGCSAASITMSQAAKVSEQGIQSLDPTGCCTPQCPFLADRFFLHFFFEIW